MGQPERISIPRGHKRAFLSMTPLGAKWLQKRDLELSPRDPLARPVSAPAVDRHSMAADMRAVRVDFRALLVVRSIMVLSKWLETPS